MVKHKPDLLQGTLDMLILKTLALGPRYGWGISQRIQQVSGKMLQVNQGSLYPALHRLEQRGWLRSSWGSSENNRQAKFYALTRTGRRQLEQESRHWARLSTAVARIMEATCCGKSTLLSILGLLDTPSDGHYQLNGQSVANLKMSEPARTRNREIGFIFQSFNLIGDLSVYENVELPLTYRGMRPAERKERVTDALEKVDMAHRAKHLPSQLSDGQQHRSPSPAPCVGSP